MALSIAIVLQPNEHGGLKKWASAMALESVAWSLFAIHGITPLVISVILANFILSTAQAIKLTAIYEYRGLACPSWQCMLPVSANLFTFVFYCIAASKT